MPVILVTFVVLCAGVDIRSRRIPNVVSGSGMLVGLCLNTFQFGVPGLISSLGGMLLMLVILFPPFAAGGVGGGDVKMMAAVGALLGPRLAVLALTFGMILGGAVMLCHLARRGALREKLSALGGMVTAAVATRSLSPLRVSSAEPGAIALPYSIPLGLGAVAALTFSGCLGFSA